MATYDFTGANGDPVPSGLTVVDGNFEIQDNKLKSISGGSTSGRWFVSFERGDAPLSTHNTPFASADVYHAFRFVDANNFLALQFFHDLDKIRLVKIEGGAYNLVQEYDFSLSNNTDYTVAFDLSGGDIVATVNGTGVVNVTGNTDFSSSTTMAMGSTNFGPTFDDLDTGESASAAPDTSTLAPFTLNKLVVLGDSIQNQAFTDNLAMVESYYNNKYGTSITVVEEAVGGSTVADLRANIDTYVATHAGPGVVFSLIIGFNDVVTGSGGFLGQTETKRNQLISDLEYIYDAIHSAGCHVIQGSISMPTRSLSHFDEGLTQVNELNGTYPWTRDWIVPVMQNKAPYALYDRDGQDWPYMDLFNTTRNIFTAYTQDGVDLIHPSIYARMNGILTVLDAIRSMSQGVVLAPIPRRDYTVEASAGDAIGVVADLSDEASSPNPSSGINTLTLSSNFITNARDTSGNTLSGVNLFTWGTIESSTGAGNAGNNGASLQNDALLSSAIGRDLLNDGMYVVIEGLNPLKKYNLEFVASSIPGRTIKPYLHDSEAVQDVPTYGTAVNDPASNNIIVKEAVADGMGRIVFCSEELNGDQECYISGVSVSSDGAAANQPPTANAGTNQSVAAGVTVQLDGTGSTIGGTYEWVQVSGPTVKIVNADSAKARIITPQVTTDEQVVMGLTVTQNGVSSTQSTVTISIAAWKGGFVSSTANVARG